MTHIIYVQLKYCRTSTAVWSGALGHQAKEVESQVTAIQTPVVQCGIRRGVWSQVAATALKQGHFMNLV